MSKPLVEVRGLVRWFDQVRAVNGVSFDLPAGQVVGLIGANGAGKTTAMRIMATLDQADAGTVLIDGVDIVEHPETVRRRLGWMPDSFAPYPDMTVGECLDFFGRAHGFRGRQLLHRVAEVMDLSRLAVSAEIPAAEAGDLKPGNPVEVLAEPPVTWPWTRQAQTNLWGWSNWPPGRARPAGSSVPTSSVRPSSPATW